MVTDGWCVCLHIAPALPTCTLIVQLWDSGSLSAQSCSPRGQSSSWYCLLHWTRDWQPVSFYSRKGCLDPNTGSNYVNFNAFSPVSNAWFPASLWGTTCVVWRTTLWPGTSQTSVAPFPGVYFARQNFPWAQITTSFPLYSLNFSVMVKAFWRPFSQPSHWKDEDTEAKGRKGTYCGSHIYSWTPGPVFFPLFTPGFPGKMVSNPPKIHGSCHGRLFV